MPVQINDEKIITSILTSTSKTDAAKKAGVDRRTITRRLKDPGFIHKLEVAQRAQVRGALSRLNNANLAAVNTLISLLEADSESVQLRAATKIIELSEKLWREVELEDRITRLELTIARLISLRE